MHTVSFDGFLTKNLSKLINYKKPSKKKIHSKEFLHQYINIFFSRQIFIFDFYETQMIFTILFDNKLMK